MCLFLQDARTVWNFAFGANLSSKTLRRRKLQPRVSVRAELPGWCYSTCYRGLPYMEPSFATIVRADDTPVGAGQPRVGTGPASPGAPHTVHGVLHKLTWDDWQRVVKSEGGGGYQGLGYAAVPVECLVYADDADTAQLTAEERRATRDDGRVVVKALALVAQNHIASNRNIPPSSRYASLVAEGE